eukprot:Nk52_evm7s211 gene=Nk52_evmTU7s211
MASSGRLGCGYGLIGFWLFLTNFAVLLAGGAIIGLISYAIANDYGDSFKALKDSYDFDTIYVYLPGYLAIGIASIMVIYSFLGCCGAIRRSTRMMMAFIVLAFIGILINGAGIGLSFWGRSEGRDYIDGSLTSSLKSELSDASSFCQKFENKTDPLLEMIWAVCYCPGFDPSLPFCEPPEGKTQEDVSKAIDTVISSLPANDQNNIKNLRNIQTTVDCCSIETAWDYRNAKSAIFWNATYCSLDHSKGCIPKTKSLIDDATIYIVYGFIILAAVLVINIVFAFVYRSGISKSQYTEHTASSKAYGY